MRIKLLFIAFCLSSLGQQLFAKKTIHIYLALCDNKYQGIVKVPAGIGNGQEPKTNLYWGAGYGLKHYFLNVSKEWTVVKKVNNPKTEVLERLFLKHKTSDTYLIADAYDGKEMKQTLTDYLDALHGNKTEVQIVNKDTLKFGGGANLVAFVGHNGLMDVDVDNNFTNANKTTKDAIMICCISKSYFTPFVKTAKANPLVWSTGLMSAEAYTLEWALRSWIKGETKETVREQAAAAYHNYQKCGMKAAKNLLVTGF